VLGARVEVGSAITKVWTPLRLPDAKTSDPFVVEPLELVELLNALTGWHRVGERLHAAGIINERSNVALERWLHPVLFVVGEAGPLRVTEIAGALGLLESTASRRVSQLAAKGYVDRTADASDGRALRVALTPLGAETRVTLIRAWTSVFADALATWPETKRLQFIEALGQFVRGVKTVAGH
jgi:DNA-binding MarR family transcriptional regulator